MFHKLVFDLKVSPQTTFDALKHLALDEPEEDLLADATRGAGNDLTQGRRHGPHLICLLWYPSCIAV